MLEKDLEIFNDSLERCRAKGNFIDRFYERFLASSPQVAEKFKHTDFTRQRRMLQASLYTILLCIRGTGPNDFTPLEHVAYIHSREVNDIKPELYDYWLEALLATVLEFDHRVNDQILNIWKMVLTPAIEYMQSKY